VYRSVLELAEEDRDLYLAIAKHVYEDFFRRQGVQRIIAHQAAKLSVFDPDQEVVEQWID